MNVEIQAPFMISRETKRRMGKKLKGLENYFNNITQANVYFKLNGGKQPDAVLAQIEVRIPGEDVFASDSALSFIEAFQGAFDKSKRQLLKAKENMQSHKA